jgi:hypothetical protein
MDRQQKLNLLRSDYDQAARCLQHACDLMDRQAPGKMRATLDVLRLAIRRLSPGDHFVGDAAAEITVLRHAADQMPVADARTEILKAVAVLRDRF